MTTIDSLQIKAASGAVVATIARKMGPVENAFRDISGNEVLVSGQAKVGFTNNFGIDGSGHAYFDTTGNVPATDMADVWVDPVALTFTFRSGDDR